MNEKTQTVFRFVYSEAVVRAFRKLNKCQPIDQHANTINTKTAAEPSRRDLDADIVRLPEIYKELISDGIDPLNMQSSSLLRGDNEEEQEINSSHDTDNVKLPALQAKSKPPPPSVSRMGKRGEQNKVKLPLIK